MLYLQKRNTWAWEFSRELTTTPPHTESYTIQAGPKLILLPPLSECWDYRHESPTFM